MPRWRVDYIGKGGKHLGTVEAATEREAIAEAAKQFNITAKQFNITPASQNKIVVVKIGERKAVSDRREFNQRPGAVKESASPATLFNWRTGTA